MACPRVGIKSGSESIGRLTVIRVRADRNHGAIRSDDVEIKLTAGYCGSGEGAKQPNDSHQKFGKVAWTLCWDPIRANRKGRATIGGVIGENDPMLTADVPLKRTTIGVAIARLHHRHFSICVPGVEPSPGFRLRVDSELSSLFQAVQS